jgi:SAM-dependent methyltransferase
MKDYLKLHLRELPYFRSLMRAVEASFYHQLDLPEPLLDVGCGDGHFAGVAFDHILTMGLDPAFASLKETSQRGCYRFLTQADGKRMPYRDGVFASAFSNSVLEHIPGVESVLHEVSRVLRHGAPFVFCGPNDRFLSALSVSNFLDKVRLPGLAERYRRFFNQISRHYNSDPPEVWSSRLEQAGFTLDRYWHYYPPDALRVTEWGHYFGLPSLIWKKITGRWVLVPTDWNLKLTELYTRRHYYPYSRDDGVCTFYLAHRN